MSSDFMAAVTISSVLEPKKRKSVTTSTFPPFFLPWIFGPNAMILDFLIFSFKPLFDSPPSPSSRGSLVPHCFLPLEWYHPHIWCCWCFSQLSWFHSSSSAFLMMHSVYRLNKQGDSRQPYGIPFSILNKPVVSYRVLTIASWPAYTFLSRQVRWCGIRICLKSLLY